MSHKSEANQNELVLSDKKLDFRVDRPRPTNHASRIPVATALLIVTALTDYQ